MNILLHSLKITALYRCTSRLRMHFVSRIDLSLKASIHIDLNIEPKSLIDGASPSFSNRNEEEAILNSCKSDMVTSNTTTESPLKWESSKIFDDLKEWRKLHAKNAGISASSICTNKMFEDIIHCKVNSLVRLSNITGFTAKKVSKYGQDILQILEKYDSAVANRDIDADIFEEVPLLHSPTTLIPASTTTNNIISTNRQHPSKIVVSDLINELSQEQRDVVEAILQGTNAFVTGAAGTGKSTVLKTTVAILKDRLGEDAVVVTAPTGIAAVNIGGQTIHSFAGLVMKDQKDGTSKLRSFRSGSLKEKWKKTKVIIIDEVSVLSPEIFEMLEQICRVTNRNSLPFGGMQLILFGDFLQLPPIVEGNKSGNNKRFCFESLVWTNANFQTFELIEVIRQKDDPIFRNILHEVRRGILTAESINILNTCVIPKKAEPNDGILPTKLYCTNKDVDYENSISLANLPGPNIIIQAVDIWRGQRLPTEAIRKLNSDLMEKRIPSELHLKVGAQVVLLRNRAAYGSSGEISLCNGSRGVVIGFRDSSSDSNRKEPLIRFDNGQEVYIGFCKWSLSGQDKEIVNENEEEIDDTMIINGGLIRKQIPLKLAWALTIHKSQGLTLTRATLALGGAFDFGQAYTALSRVKNMAGLWLTAPVTRRSIITSETVLKFYGYK